MKIKLISPGWTQTSLWSVLRLKLPPLNLAIIASLNPDDDVEIIDENNTPINFSDEADIVGISVITPLAQRAYEIADVYRNAGVKVVLGGIHPSLMPYEAVEHADSVIVGEAECNWNELITDYKKGNLKKIYKSEKKADLVGLPIPRRDLYQKGKYLTNSTIQISRGCPFECNFCVVTEFFGNTYRFRPIDDVIREIEMLKSKTIFFVDDNIVGNFTYAKQLFEALNGLGINWVSQSSINISNNDKLLELAADSGCKGLFIGFESLSNKNIEQSGKVQNRVESYESNIQKIHDHGIGIQGGFVFGFDNDDKRIFKDVLEFLRKNDIEDCQFTILTPYPGTRLYRELGAKGRILHNDWSKYDCAHVVFQPKMMSIDELQNGFMQSYNEFYSYKSIFRRMLKSKRYLKLIDI